jgi:putative redox protein
MRTEVRVRGHHFVADEPVAAGGTDTGPSPYELLIAALAACTSVTARMYAERKGWPLDGIEVRVWHQRTNESDPAIPDSRPVQVDAFDVEIRFDGDLDSEQRARLLEISGRCPVKRTLLGKVRINTRLAF